jgi:hypothetical protein
MDDDRDSLTPSEAARERRRDHDAEANKRAGMKTGLAKQFKQVLDMQVKRGKEAERMLGGPEADDDDRAGDDGGRTKGTKRRKG